MKRIKEDIKQMLNGLAYQNASDFLTRQQKMSVLAGKVEKDKTADVVELVVNKQEGDLSEVVLLEKTAA